MYENQDNDIITKSYNKSLTGLISKFQFENPEIQGHGERWGRRQLSH